MHFGFTEEQQAFGSLARKVATDISPASDSESDRFQVGPDAQKVLSETGLLGLLIPEDQGGSGATLIEGAIFAEELGRALAPASVTALRSSLLPPFHCYAMSQPGTRWLRLLHKASSAASSWAPT